mgnify:CR=1 FL=1
MLLRSRKITGLEYLHQQSVGECIKTEILTLIFIYTLTTILPHTRHSPPHPGHMREQMNLNAECKQKYNSVRSQLTERSEQQN